MYISGTVSKISSAANGEIDFIGGNSDVNTSRTTTRAGGIHIAEGDALTLGDNVNLYNGSFPDSESGRANNQTFYVEGTLNVTGENASFSNTISQSGITAGRITVTGTVVIGPEATGNDNGGYYMSGTVNGTRYTLTTTENNVTTTTVYYASFDVAVQHIADSYNDTINVYGQQSVGTDVTIANGTTVSLDRSAILTVDEDITLTIATGGKVLGTQATIIVDGTMTAQNYREDITAGTIKADVIIDEAPARTWTTFAQALADAEPPATITLVQDITLTENTTIPEGITVNTRYKVNTDRYTLTVDGTLDVGVGGGINTDGITSDRDGDVVANGVVVMRSQGQSQANVDTLKAFDGAHFQLQSGATVSNYVTNLAYAAENVTSGTVTISGAVTGGEVVFTEAANATVPLVISVVTDRDFQDVDTVLSMTSITLNGAEFNVDGLSKVTGTIIVPCGDGTVNAEIELSRASGLFYVSSTSQVDATSTQYSAVLSGSVTDGTMTVAAGTVDIGTAGFTASSDFTVASGATLVLENTLTANDDDQGAAYVTIDGTLEIDGGAFDGDSIIINGTASYVDNASTGIVIYANGEIVVGEDATLTVNSKMVVGTPAASLGVGGAITGKYLIVNGSEGIGYILAYAGADLSGAQINWNTATQESDAQTTTYYINDVEYATVYANGGVNINSVFGTADTQEEISLSGLVSDYNWYATPEDVNDDAANPVTGAIGTEESVYNVFDPAKVSGVVTVGAGIDLFIDGVQVSGYGPGNGTSVGSNLELSVGTHRVSYEIRAGWDGSSVSFTFNGQTIESGATITITADMTSFTLSATGATNSTGTSGGSTSSGDDGMGLTDYLLIVLVVLIVIMAIMVALRLMRS